MKAFTAIKQWAKRIQLDAFAVYHAAKDTRTPRCLRLLAFVVVAYAISPIDLIPDFISVLGYLDDLLIVPVGFLLVIKLLPTAVWADSRAKASSQSVNPASFKYIAVVVSTWLLCVALLLLWWYSR